MLLLNLFLFGAIGLLVWAVQMLWIPWWATGIINGVGHYWGYRNFEAPDASRNVTPWGILIGGEELHNNHHTYPTSAKFSVKPLRVRHRLGLHPRHGGRGPGPRCARRCPSWRWGR